MGLINIGSIASHKAFKRLCGQADVALAVAVISVCALLILPIPTFLIDIFICANISAAIVVLLISIYIPNSLRLSSFPTILLISTLFRLGLNVATSRLILLNADAGHMVLAFGNTVVGGNLVVGIVIFLLLMLINMLVVAKGSERVAEVAARFTLDAMPGKQMSIDADLRSGILDLNEARKKREDLNRESQLFGAMDGAMKFVKGDVIAGIIIFVINIVAGIIIGTFQHGMDLEEALSTFAILSVGDGLVSIIPGLLMSVCAGLIVTRVDSFSENENHLGAILAAQVLAHPKAYFIAAAFIAMISIIPGLPTIPLATMSTIVLMIGLVNRAMAQRKKTEKNTQDASYDHGGNERNKEQGSEERAIGVLPICIEVADNLIPFVDDSSNFITDLIPLVRESLALELGIDFPGIRVRPASLFELESSHYTLILNEVPVAKGMAEPELCLVAAAPHELISLGIKEVSSSKNPCNRAIASLTPMKHRAILEQAGFMVWDAPSQILLHLSAVLRKNAKDFITLHETQTMLDRLEQQCPSLVKEVVPKTISLIQLTEILKRLLSEEISIKDLKTILQALAEFAPMEQDGIMLTEHVRTSLSRSLCFRYAQGRDTLLVYLLAPEIEDMVRSSIINKSGQAYLALEPDTAQDILTAIGDEIGQLPPSARQPIILTNQDLRRFVRKLIEVDFYEVAVMSYQELSSDYKAQPIGCVRLIVRNEQEIESQFAGHTDSPFAPAPAMP